MILKEDFPIVIERYPYSESLNKKLLKDMKNVPWRTKDECNYYTNIFADQCHCSDSDPSPGLLIVKEWVEKLLRSKVAPDYYLGAKEHDAKIDIRMWYAKYDKGDYTQTHRHSFVLYAFVYFIKTPKGSSPLVFTKSGKKIKAEEGKVVIFPGGLRHHVPKNRCDDRIIVAGNVVFTQ